MNLSNHLVNFKNFGCFFSEINPKQNTRITANSERTGKSVIRSKNSNEKCFVILMLFKISKDISLRWRCQAFLLYKCTLRYVLKEQRKCGRLESMGKRSFIDHCYKLHRIFIVVTLVQLFHYFAENTRWAHAKKNDKNTCSLTAPYNHTTQQCFVFRFDCFVCFGVRLQIELYYKY